MCSKHVEVWNKLIIKFTASSWLILRNLTFYFYWSHRSMMNNQCTCHYEKNKIKFSATGEKNYEDFFLLGHCSVSIHNRLSTFRVELYLYSPYGPVESLSACTRVHIYLYPYVAYSVWWLSIICRILFRTAFDLWIAHTEWPKKMYTLFTHQYLWNKFQWNFYFRVRV